jgi:NAD(P)H-hydrate epimerase
MQNNKLFLSEQIREIDKYTILNEPVKSIDLMERAAVSILSVLSKNVNLYQNSFTIICGVGNNGGDGLAIARLLCDVQIKTKVIFCKFSSNISEDCKINLEKFEEKYNDNLIIIIEENIEDLEIDKHDIIIDCLFGTGLSRPVKGAFAKIVNKINNICNNIVSVDIPSGLFGEDNSLNDGAIIKADTTITIQFPPISAMFPENNNYYGKLIVVPIGLSEDAINTTPSNYYIITQDYAKCIIKKRNAFGHKGNFGHALLIAGSYTKGGAAALAAKSCLKSGVGLLTVHVPAKLNDIIQISVPEAMLSIDICDESFSEIPNLDAYSSIGIGPGLGMKTETIKIVNKLLQNNHHPLIIDADALNILSKETDFYKQLASGTILTPHPKEFERLFGKFKSSWEKLEFMSGFSKKTGIIIVLKGGITIISLSDGRIIFNTGLNSGMATAGSGDVLTGIITSLLAQAYSPDEAAILGVYIHSKAGENAKKKLGEHSMIATDIINNLHEVFIKLE